MKKGKHAKNGQKWEFSVLGVDTLKLPEMPAMTEVISYNSLQFSINEEQKVNK